MEKQKANLIMKDMEAAVQAVATKHNVKIKADGGTLGVGYATLKFKINSISADGVVESKEANDFKLYAHAYGLKAAFLGKKFFFQGAEHEVVGLAIRRKKNPIMLRNLQTNKVMLYPQFASVAISAAIEKAA